MGTGTIIFSSVAGLGVAGGAGYLAWQGGRWMNRNGDVIHPPTPGTENGYWSAYPPSLSHPGYLEEPVSGRPLRNGETLTRVEGTDRAYIVRDGHVVVRLIRANGTSGQDYGDQGGEEVLSSYNGSTGYDQAHTNRAFQVVQHVNQSRGVTPPSTSTGTGAPTPPTDFNKMMRDYLPWALAGGGGLLAALGGGSTMTLVLGGLVGATGLAMGFSNGAFGTGTSTTTPPPATVTPPTQQTGAAQQPEVTPPNVPTQPRPGLSLP